MLVFFTLCYVALMIVKFCELNILKIGNKTEQNIQECGLQGEMIACCALQLKNLKACLRKSQSSKHTSLSPELLAETVPYFHFNSSGECDSLVNFQKLKKNRTEVKRFFLYKAHLFQYSRVEWTVSVKKIELFQFLPCKLDACPHLRCG